MKFKFLLAPAILLSACGRSDHQNVNQFPSDLTSREAVAYPPAPAQAPAQRPTAPKTPSAPVGTSQPILRAQPRAQSDSPAPQVPTATTEIKESSPPSDALENQPLPIFEISSLPPRDTSNETEYAPMEEDEVQASSPVEPTRTANPTEVRTAPRTAPSEARGMEKQLLDLINAERARQGIAPLKFSRAQSKGNGQCMGSAGHSELMAQSRRLSHDNFPRNICLRSGASAENVGYATGDETRALRTIHQSMMNSEGHRANIMSPQYNTVGLGFFYYKGTLWVTESFLRL